MRQHAVLVRVGMPPADRWIVVMAMVLVVLVLVCVRQDLMGVFVFMPTHEHEDDTRQRDDECHDFTSGHRLAERCPGKHRADERRRSENQLTASRAEFSCT